MAQIREKGIYAFATPPGNYGVLTAKYRLLLERDDYDSIQRSIRYWDVTQHEPYFPFLDTDLSPEAIMVTRSLREPVPENIESWMMKEIEFVSNRTLRTAELVFEHLGEDYVLNNFCPVAWMTPTNQSEKELKEKIAGLIASSGRQTIPTYNVAVSDESKKQYGISMPVVWMRRSFLRTFKTGNEVLNIYRMMGDKITEKYDIPAYREENSRCADGSQDWRITTNSSIERV